MSVLSTLRHPIIAAPMAGGPSTPALVAAVSAAGGLGFLAAGMIDTDRLVADVAEVRARTDRPFGVNVFLPDPGGVDEAAIRAYAERLAPQAAQRGVAWASRRAATTRTRRSWPRCSRTRSRWCPSCSVCPTGRR